MKKKFYNLRACLRLHKGNLIPLIKHHVEHMTTVYPDGLSAFSGLPITKS